MNPEDEEARRARALLVPPALDSLGVEELTFYISVLKGEILRVEAAISAKSAHRAAAASFFRTGPTPDPDA